MIKDKTLILLLVLFVLEDISTHGDDVSLNAHVYYTIN